MAVNEISKNAATLFDIITSYHINYTYINLYSIVSSRVGKNPDISKSDIYMGVLSEALSSYYLQKGYFKNLSGLHQYFCKHTKFSNMAFKDFINKIVQELVPADYYPSLDSKQKHIIIASVLKNTLRGFVNNIIKIRRESAIR